LSNDSTEKLEEKNYSKKTKATQQREQFLHKLYKCIFGNSFNSATEIAL